MTKRDEPAFPVLMKAGEVAKSEGGLTKREYMATAIFAQMVSDAGPSSLGRYGGIWAEASVSAADALIEELAK